MTADPRIPCDLLIAGGLLMILDEAGSIVPDGAVAIADTRILAVGKGADLARRYAPARTIDARDRIVMPGFVNVHNHTPLMITRGMIEDLGFAPMYTAGIPQGHRLSAEEAYLLSRLGAYELLRAGCTTVMDFYRYPQSCARAHEELGLRAVIGGRVHDADPEAIAQGRHEYSAAVGAASLAENARLIEEWNGRGNGRIRCDWAPHAPDTCSDPLLREVAQVAAGHDGKIHTHLAQSAREVTLVRERSGRSPAEALDEAGLLDQRTIAAHCIHLDDADIARVGRAGITVAHSPIGNAKSGEIAPIMALVESGATIALCTDTMSGDMIEAMRWSVALQRVRGGGRFVLDAATALGWATRAGARALGFGDQVGSIEVGKKADIILLDATAPSLAPIVDGHGIVVYSASGHDVDTVVVDGRVLLEGGRLVTGDGPEIVRLAQVTAERLWRDAGRVPVALAGRHATGA